MKKQILAGADRPDPAAAAASEAELLIKLHSAGVPVPRLISRTGEILTMEAIEGITLTEAVERAERGEAGIPPALLAASLADWFDLYYKAVPLGCIRGDVNGRNFIVTLPAKITGVDFERQAYGCRETDLGRLLAFVLNDAPPYTAYKQALAEELTRSFCAHFELDNDEVLSAKRREEKEMSLRRR